MSSLVDDRFLLENSADRRFLPKEITDRSSPVIKKKKKKFRIVLEKIRYVFFLTHDFLPELSSELH